MRWEIVFICEKGKHKRIRSTSACHSTSHVIIIIIIIEYSKWICVEFIIPSILCATCCEVCPAHFYRGQTKWNTCECIGAHLQSLSGYRLAFFIEKPAALRRSLAPNCNSILRIFIALSVFGIINSYNICYWSPTPPSLWLQGGGGSHHSIAYHFSYRWSRECARCHGH